MRNIIQYFNLITNEPASESPAIRAYFELAITRCDDGFQYGTSEGEFLCAFGFHFTYKEAWLDAITYTTIGGKAYHAYTNGDPVPAVTIAEPFDTTQSNYDGLADDEGFDPYAGNLDQLFEAHAEVEDYGFDYDWER